MCRSKQKVGFPNKDIYYGMSEAALKNAAENANPDGQAKDFLIALDHDFEEWFVFLKYASSL